jgi:hypothetical protein
MMKFLAARRKPGDMQENYFYRWSIIHFAPLANGVGHYGRSLVRKRSAARERLKSGRSAASARTTYPGGCIKAHAASVSAALCTSPAIPRRWSASAPWR